MADVAVDTITDKVKRPNFLTAACILSCIWSCWGLISGFLLFMKAGAQAISTNNLKEVIYSDDFQKKIGLDISLKDAMEMADRMADAFTLGNLRIIAIASVLGSLLCLMGALRMWQLNKKGLYFYLSGTLFGLLILLILFGFSKTLVMGILALNGLISLFVVLGSTVFSAYAISVAIVFFWLVFIGIYCRYLRIMQ